MSASSSSINTINVIDFTPVVSAVYPTLETIVVSDSVRADYDRGGITLLAKNVACSDTYRFQAYMVVFVTEGIAYLSDVKIGDTPSPQKSAIGVVAKSLSTDSRNSSRQQWVEFCRLSVAAISAGIDISALQSMTALRNTKTPKAKNNISDVDAYAPILLAAQEAQQEAAQAVRLAVEEDAARKESEEKQLGREHALNASIGALQGQIRDLENASRVSGDALANKTAFLAFADRKIAFLESMLNKAQAGKLEAWKASNA